MQLPDKKRFIYFFLILLIILTNCSREKEKIIVNVIPGELSKRISEENIQAFLLYYNDELMWSQYEEYWNPEGLHRINSCTKSVVSLLIGTLFDQGLLDSLDTPVYTLFKKISHEEIPEDNKKVTLEHFLTMTTGLRSRDSYLYQWEGIDYIWRKDNCIKEILTFKSEVSGGKRFDYSNLSTFLLGEVIRERTGLDVSDYAEKVLFKPLGIKDYVWDKNINGESLAYGGLNITPQDLAKIGQLVLNNGIWNGNQIISADWIQKSTTSKVKSRTLREFYGYQWWIDKEDRILALGYEGQYLIIDPELDLVTVFASKLDRNDFFLPYQLYTQYIVPYF